MRVYGFWYVRNPMCDYREAGTLAVRQDSRTVETLVWFTLLTGKDE